MKCDCCGCKLSRIKRFYHRWFTEDVVYTIHVADDDGVIIEKFPVCPRCGVLYEYLVTLHTEFGLEGIKEFIDNVEKNVN